MIHRQALGRVMFVIAGPLAAGCGSQAESGPVPATAVPVRVARIETREVTQRLVLTGTLRPRLQIEVVAQVPGRLLRLSADEGRRVTAGQVLAVLDDTDTRLAHERARAAVAVAEANRAHALVERTRADNLLETGGITDQGHLAARVNLQVAEAALAQANAEAAIAAEHQARTKVKAPFSGKIARRRVDVGTMVTTNMPLLTLVDDSVFEFRASVPSSDYGKLQVGSPVTLEFNASESRSVTGELVRITPLIDERSRSFEVVVAVAGDVALVGGLFARGSVQVGERVTGPMVPPAALMRDGGTPGRADVFVVVGGRAKRRSILLGLEQPQAVQVTEGLDPGDLVVLEPPTGLRSGNTVAVQGETADRGTVED